MTQARRYLPALLCVFAACGPSGPLDPPLIVSLGDGGVLPEDAASPPPLDASDARVLGEAVLVSPDKLGCDGNMRIEGPPIVAASGVHLHESPDRGLVSFADGTVGSVTGGLVATAARLDERLLALEARPIGTWSELARDSSGKTYHFRNGSHLGLFYGGRVPSPDPLHIAMLYGYDFTTGEKLERTFIDTVAGKRVRGWAATGDETSAYGWALVAESVDAMVAYRVPLRKDGAWQRTELGADLPTNQWQEGAKTHFLVAGARDVVLDGDGKVENDTPFAMVPDTTTPCAVGKVARTGSSLVTIREVADVSCTDPAYATAPYALWVHLPGDTAGRKLADGLPRTGERPRIVLHSGPDVDSFVRFEVTGPDVFTAKLQRLDASLRDRGNSVEVALSGRPGPSQIVAVGGGYYWFVGALLPGGDAVSTTAYRLVCGD